MMYPPSSSTHFQGPWDTNPSSPKRPKGTKEDRFNDFFTKGPKPFKKMKLPSFFDSQNPRFFIVIGMLILGFWLASGFYIVEPEEEAAVLRFGKYHRAAYPGLNYALPHPFERVIKQKVMRIEREEIGFRSNQFEGARGFRNVQKNLAEESLMLTGDENIVDINFEVQWKIRNLKDYLFNLHIPKETVKSAAESAMREVIGNTPIAAALADGRSEVERKTLELLQQVLDSYQSGVEVIRLQMLKVDPPAEVVDAFRDVQTARADKEREINQAQAYQNDAIPRARGEAARIIQDAEAYKQEVIARASGDANRFLAIHEEYKLARDITSKRLYLETMESILQGMDKIIVDSSKSTQGILPYLPLPSISKKSQ